MPFGITNTDPRWRLDLGEFEIQAAAFLKGQGIVDDSGRLALVNGASQALLNNMIKAMFNCVKVST